jgi:5-methylcytosine-specific restriction endonuclease McrA
VNERPTKPSADPEYRREYRKRNAEAIREYMAIYRAEHAEEMRLQHDEYYATHREQYSLWRRDRHEARREEDNEQSRAYHAANREKRNAQSRDYSRSHRYQAMARAQNSRFGEVVHWSVFARIAHLPCFACGVTPSAGVDHIIPKAKGGRNVVDNLQPSCIPCNQRKSATFPWSSHGGGGLGASDPLVRDPRRPLLGPRDP